MSSIHPDTKAGPSKAARIIAKRAVLVRNILGLALCAAVSASALLMDNQGVSLVALSQQHSLMHAVFVLFACLGAYFALMLLSILQIHVKHGNESEIRVKSACLGVSTAFSWDWAS